MQRKDHTILFFLLVLFSCLLLCYTGYRASSVPMTHDESSTWLSLRTVGFWKSLQTPFYWTDANNHLLNTFLFQHSLAIFGQSDWAFRLPNVLAHAVYLGASIYILLQLTTKPIVGLAGWAILNLNPYLLDFFSLARGYGLAMGCTLLSLAFFINYLKRPRWSITVWIFIAAGVSVLSNFTQLIFHAALWLVYLVVSWRFLKIPFKQLMRWQISPFLVLSALGILLWRPILWLQQAGEFEWGSSQLKDTFWHLVADSLYQQGYFSAYTIPVFCYILSALSLLIIGKGLLFFKDKRGNFLKESPPLLHEILYAAISLFFVTIIGIMIVQKLLLGSEYLVNRKALLFIPIWSLLVFSSVLPLFKNRPKLRIGIISFLAFASIWHFSRCMNTTETREWWYDQYTLEMLEYIENKRSANTPTPLGIHWMFHPTISYYQATDRANSVQKLEYSKEYQLDKNYDYYYIFKKDYDTQWQPLYEIEQSYKDTYLLHRKE